MSANVSTPVRLASSVRPAPVSNFGEILEVFARVRRGALEVLAQFLGQLVRASRRKGRKPNRESREVEPAHVVERHHVEGSGRRSLLVESAHVKSRRIG